VRKTRRPGLWRNNCGPMSPPPAVLPWPSPTPSIATLHPSCPKLVPLPRRYRYQVKCPNGAPSPSGGFASKGQVAPKGSGLPQKSVDRLVKRLLQAHRLPGPPHLFFHQHVKPVGACAGDHRARLFFPGHFIPAPFFNEGTSLVGN
jgi:hypothetical protein